MESFGAIFQNQNVFDLSEYKIVHAVISDEQNHLSATVSDYASAKEKKNIF